MPAHADPAPAPRTAVAPARGSAIVLPNTVAASGDTPAATGRRERSITVETEALGLLRVRRVSLGGIARCADRLRSTGSQEGAALVDALITEVAAAGDGAGGPRRRIGFEQVARLTVTDRRSIAAAVLTLEGVKAAGEGVLHDPLASLVQRYGPMVGIGEQGRRPRVDFASEAAGVRAEPADPVPDEAGQGELPDEAGATSSDRPSGDPVLPDHDDDATASGAEPQIPLFDAAQAPPGVAHRLPEREPASVAEPRPSRAAERARIEDLLDAQHRGVLGLADEQRALAAEVAALAQRAERAEAIARRNRWLAAGALAVAVVLSVAQAAWFAGVRRGLADDQQQARARLDQQAAEIRELRTAATRGERAATPRAPAPAATAPAKPRKDSAARAR